jgi:hypothetical protein
MTMIGKRQDKDKTKKQDKDRTKKEQGRTRIARTGKGHDKETTRTRKGHGKDLAR